MKPNTTIIVNDKLSPAQQLLKAANIAITTHSKSHTIIINGKPFKVTIEPLCTQP
jgi:hypothetical protein